MELMPLLCFFEPEFHTLFVLLFNDLVNDPLYNILLFNLETFSFAGVFSVQLDGSHHFTLQSNIRFTKNTGKFAGHFGESNLLLLTVFSFQVKFPYRFLEELSCRHLFPLNSPVSIVITCLNHILNVSLITKEVSLFLSDS